MIHFVYTYSEHTPRHEHTQKTVSVYRIVNNVPRHLVTRTDSFCDKGQLVIESLATVRKGLPHALFEKGIFGEFKYAPLWNAEELAIAKFTEL